jgi:hypothetical protein
MILRVETCCPVSVPALANLRVFTLTPNTPYSLPGLSIASSGAHHHNQAARAVGRQFGTAAWAKEFAARRFIYS